MATPPITKIVPVSVEYTPRGVFVTINVTYKGGTKSVVTLAAANIVDTAKLSRPVGEFITKRGFGIGA